MSNTRQTPQFFQFGAGKHIFDQAISFVQVDPVTLQRGDARCVLSPVLQDGQRIIDRGRDCLLSDNANDSTHSEYPCF
jgi:hypothetical protein